MRYHSWSSSFKHSSCYHYSSILVAVFPFSFFSVTLLSPSLLHTLQGGERHLLSLCYLLVSVWSVTVVAVLVAFCSPVNHALTTPARVPAPLHNDNDECYSIFSKCKWKILQCVKFQCEVKITPQFQR